MSPENERFLRQLVEHGRFPTFDAALDAVVGFVKREHEDAEALMREKLEEAFEDERAGRVGPLDIEEFKRQGRERWEARRRRAEAG